MMSQTRVSSRSRQGRNGHPSGPGAWRGMVVGSFVVSGASVAFGGASWGTTVGHEAPLFGLGGTASATPASIAAQRGVTMVSQASTPSKPETSPPKPTNAPTQASPSSPPTTEKEKAPAPTVPPNESDKKPIGESKPSGGKSLDELLGLPGSKPAADGTSKSGGANGGTNGTGTGATRPAGKEDTDGTASDPALAEAKRCLERGLNEAELDSLLRQALAGMESSATRLGESTDTGLATQRVQEDVVAKLDQLIQEAKRRSKSGQSSSSGSSSGSSSSQAMKQASGAKPGEKGDQKPGESKTRSGSQRARGDGNKEGEGPAPIDPSENQAELDESQAEWGALPDRVRDLIRQGSRDRIASIYQRLTQEYYRRMAEDASR